MIELEVQVPGEVQPPAPVERGHPARHRHLGHDLPLDPLGLHVTDRRQGFCPRKREFADRRRFPRGRGVLRDLGLGNGVEQLPFTCGEGPDHGFDSRVSIMDREEERRKDQGARNSVLEHANSTMRLCRPGVRAGQQVRGVA